MVLPVVAKLVAFAGTKWALVAGAAAIAVVSGAAGYKLCANIKDVAIERAKSETVKLRSDAAERALSDVQAATSRMRLAAENFNTFESTLGERLDKRLAAIQKDVKAFKPLPVDCKPDPDRVRRLNSTVDAINAESPVRYGP